MMVTRGSRCILFDWGDTLMRVFPGFSGPMIHWPRLQAMPHAPETLARLHPTWMLALATNSTDSNEDEIRLALQKVGLDRYIDRIYNYRKIGHRKPQPEFFEFILADLGLAASQVIMVGDDFETDVQGANRCGIRAIWLDLRTGPIPQEQHFCTIHDLSALPQALKNLGYFE